MGFQLEKVVPWGRSLDEYVAMFALTEADLSKTIVGCGDGPAAFNAQLTRRGGRVVSVDPLYVCSRKAIRQRIDATFDQVMAETRKNSDEFVWETIPSVDALGRLRMAAMQAFLDDYAQGRAQRRYLAASLPELPLADDSFDLALCSHLLFLYSAQLDADFHIRSILEMGRIAAQVRIFPLLQLGGRPSPHVDAVVAAVDRQGFNVQIVGVPYEFQRGGTQMMRITRR